eukprot:6553497-Karenia_brevis.AAC.1
MSFLDQKTKREKRRRYRNAEERAEDEEEMSEDSDMKSDDFDIDALEPSRYGAPIADDEQTVDLLQGLAASSSSSLNRSSE